MRDYKTTICGLLSAVGSFILFSHFLEMLTWPQWALALAMFAQVGGLAQFGVMAQDYRGRVKLPPLKAFGAAAPSVHATVAREAQKQDG